jgi:hypothetical protein
VLQVPEAKLDYLFKMIGSVVERGKGKDPAMAPTIHRFLQIISQINGFVDVLQLEQKGDELAHINSSQSNNILNSPLGNVKIKQRTKISVFINRG